MYFSQMPVLTVPKGTSQAFRKWTIIADSSNIPAALLVTKCLTQSLLWDGLSHATTGANHWALQGEQFTDEETKTLEGRGDLLRAKSRTWDHWLKTVFTSAPGMVLEDFLSPQTWGGSFIHSLIQHLSWTCSYLPWFYLPLIPFSEPIMI